MTDSKVALTPDQRLKDALTQSITFLHRWRRRECELIEPGTGEDVRLFSECGWMATTWTKEFGLPESPIPVAVECVYTPIQDGDEENLQSGCGEEWRLPHGLELYPFCPFCGKPAAIGVAS